MTTAIVIVHVLAAIFLVVVVLLQTGKGADMGAAFGGSSNTLFGAAGPATLLTRMTTAMAVTFMLTSLTLAYLSRSKAERTIFSDEAAKAAPAEPAAEAPAPAAETGIPPSAAAEAPAPSAAEAAPAAAETGIPPPAAAEAPPAAPPEAPAKPAEQ